MFVIFFFNTLCNLLYLIDNVFENLAFSAKRPAGAICPLQNAPFMLDTRNRLFNNSFINSNRFHVGSPNKGDNEYLLSNPNFVFYYCF